MLNHSLYSLVSSLSLNSKCMENISNIILIIIKVQKLDLS